jgi:hypothetical protein
LDEIAKMTDAERQNLKDECEYALTQCEQAHADAGLPAARRRYACFFEYRIGVRVNLFRALALYECYKKTWNSSAITGFGLC